LFVPVSETSRSCSTELYSSENAGGVGRRSSETVRKSVHIFLFSYFLLSSFFHSKQIHKHRNYISCFTPLLSSFHTVTGSALFRNALCWKIVQKLLNWLMLVYKNCLLLCYVDNVLSLLYFSFGCCCCLINFKL